MINISVNSQNVITKSITTPSYLNKPLLYIRKQKMIEKDPAKRIHYAIVDSLLTQTLKKAGLVALESPTGTGKTYSACFSMCLTVLFYNLCKDSGCDNLNKIIFLSQENKHLPVEDCKKIYASLFKKFYQGPSISDFQLNQLAKAEAEKEIFHYKSNQNLLEDFFINDNGASEEAMDKLIGEPGFYAQVLNIINQYRGFIDPMNFSKGNKNLPFLVNPAKVSSVIDEILRSKIRNIISRITKAAKDKLNDLTESYRIQLDESANQCSDKEQKHKLEIENEKLLIERKKSIIEKNVMGLGWLGKLYPQSITKAHIVFMSFKKFLTKDTQIVESTNDFQIEKWMKNSLIYIDEFDAAKEILWEDILENNKKSFDFIRTLWDIYKAISFGAQDINICHAFHMGQSDTPERFINESDDSARKYYNKHLSEIKDRIDALNEKFKIDWNYKLLDEDVDKKICVLINSSTYHSMSKTGKPLLYGKIDKAHCKVLMHFVSEKEAEILDKNSNINFNIRDLIIQGQNIITDFIKNFIVKTGAAYAYLINSRNKMNSSKKDYQIISPLAGRKTILSAFKLIQDRTDGEYIESTYERITEQIAKDIYDSGCTKNNRPSYPQGYFNRIEFYFLQDSPEHNETTVIDSIWLWQIPEKELAVWALQSNVIGMSATATCSPSFKNFYLDYLGENYVLGNNYSTISNENREIIEKAENTIRKPYDDGTINIDIARLPRAKEGENAKRFQYDRLKALFKEIIEKYENEPISQPSGKKTSATKKFIKLIDKFKKLKDDVNIDAYYENRLFNLYSVILDFSYIEDMQTLLYFLKKLPSSGNEPFGKKAIQNMTNEIAKAIGKEPPTIITLTSKTYKKDLEDYANAVAKGGKVIVLTSYATASRGINLTVRVPEKWKKYTVTLNSEFFNDSDKRYFEKDVDAIALDEFTHTFVQINTVEEDRKLENPPTPKDRQELFVKAVIQTKEAKGMNEISPKQERSEIRHYYASLTNEPSNKGQVYSTIKRTLPVKVQVNQGLIQAVGRADRTFNKSKHQKIYISDYNLDMMDDFELEKHILNPMMKKILTLKKSLPSDERFARLNSPESLEQNKASSQAKIIASAFRQNWRRAIIGDRRSQIIYAIQRKLALLYPTVDKDKLFKIIVSELKSNNISNFTNSDLFLLQNGWLESNNKINNYVYKSKGEDGGTVSFTGAIHGSKTISEDSSGLSVFLQYKGMVNWFEKNNIPIKWKKKHFILSPTFFDIYKGILGEVVYKKIGADIGYPIIDLPPELFERFDGQLKFNPNIYVDIKNWFDAIPNLDETAYFNTVIKKSLNVIKYRKLCNQSSDELKVLILNVCASSSKNESSLMKEFVRKVSVDEEINGIKNKKEFFIRIMTIGRLLKSDGSLNLTSDEIEALKKFAGDPHTQVPEKLFR